MRTSISLLLLLAGPLLAVNNFTGDANCVGLYTMDDTPWRHSFTDCLDGTANGNDLIVYNITQDTMEDHFKEGSAGAYSNGATLRMLYNSEGTLSSNFPGKSGTTNRTFSVCAWVRPSSVTASYSYIASKWYAGGWARCWSVLLVKDGVNCRPEISIGYSGGSMVESFMDANTALVPFTWYHIGATYDGTTKAWRIRVWKETGPTLTESHGTGAQTMNVESSYFSIFGRQDGTSCLNGYLDEVVVFNDVLTAAEIDQIRQGTYSGTASQPKRARMLITTDDFD